MGEKSEKATPKKLKDARKKGQVAKSQDFPSVFTFVTSVAVTLAMAPWIYGKLALFITTAFSSANITGLDKQLPAFMGWAIETILAVSIPILIIVVVIGVLINFLMVGPTLALEVFKPDIKKFDPIQNLKAKFKIKTLVELIKSILKIVIAGYIIYRIMYNSLPVLTQTVSMPMIGALQILYYFTWQVIFQVGLVFLVIAIADLIYQRHVFANEMKMEKFEVKQEFKNQEGDPQIKGKRKELGRELVYSDGPAQNVKKAQVVVTNPTHIAVALGYEKALDPCPYILDMGRGKMAELIIQLAEEYDVPIMRNVSLARQLYEEGEVWTYVPKDTYEAIAEIMRWVNSLQAEKNTETSLES